MLLTIVIPAYNENERLYVGYERLAPTLDAIGPNNVEVIVIDDGSTDDTMLRAREIYGTLEHTLFVQQPRNTGKGAALRLGVALASAQFVATLDADMAISPAHLIDVLEHLESEPVVVGTRSLNAHIRYNSLLRTAAARGFNQLVRRYSDLRLRDTQCGFKGYQIGPARVLSLLSMVDGFAFDVEMLYLATQLGIAVQPLLVSWQDVRGSSVRPSRVAWRMLRDIRALRNTNYENPVVDISGEVLPDDVRQLALAARLRGLVLARSPQNTLVVLPRDGALGGLAVAERFGGTLRTAGISEIARREYVAV